MDEVTEEDESDLQDEEVNKVNEEYGLQDEEVEEVNEEGKRPEVVNEEDGLQDQEEEKSMTIYKECILKLEDEASLTQKRFNSILNIYLDDLMLLLPKLHDLLTLRFFHIVCCSDEIAIYR